MSFCPNIVPCFYFYLFYFGDPFYLGLISTPFSKPISHSPSDQTAQTCPKPKPHPQMASQTPSRLAFPVSPTSVSPTQPHGLLGHQPRSALVRPTAPNACLHPSARQSPHQLMPRAIPNSQPSLASRYNYPYCHSMLLQQPFTFNSVTVPLSHPLNSLPKYSFTTQPLGYLNKKKEERRGTFFYSRYFQHLLPQPISEKLKPHLALNPCTPPNPHSLTQ